MSIHDRQLRARRLSYRVGGISFKGFIVGMTLLVAGILAIKLYGNIDYIPEIFVAIGIIAIAYGVLVELIVFLVALVE